MERRTIQPGECAACPVEVRGLYAAVSNYLTSFQAFAEGHEEADRLGRKLEQMRAARDQIKPLIDAHFANPVHAGVAIANRG